MSFRKWVVLAVLALPSLAFAQHPSPAVAAAQSYSSHERRALTADVAEYTFDVRVADGLFDEITIHRVVRESSPGVPAHTQRAVFLAAGDIWNFRAAFLTGAHPLPVYLAENGVDVWGIDYRWTRVPASTADTSFMQTWGLEQDAADLGFALGVARHARAMTGSGFDKLFLLGWSRGGQIGYAYLNGESQLAPGLRQVQGFIPVDIYLKTDDAQLRALACQRQQNTEAAIAAEQYANPVGGLVSLLGTLAVADPSGTSFLNPALTNRQAVCSSAKQRSRCWVDWSRRRSITSPGACSTSWARRRDCHTRMRRTCSRSSRRRRRSSRTVSWRMRTRRRVSRRTCSSTTTSATSPCRCSTSARAAASARTASTRPRFSAARTCVARGEQSAAPSVRLRPRRPVPRERRAGTGMGAAAGVDERAVNLVGG